jgi:hypothetical protein
MSNASTETIVEFCASENISRSQYYAMRREGWGPDEMYVGRIVRITPEAKQRWRRERERAAKLGHRRALPASSSKAEAEESAKPLPTEGNGVDPEASADARKAATGKAEAEMAETA